MFPRKPQFLNMLFDVRLTSDMQDNKHDCIACGGNLPISPMADSFSCTRSASIGTVC